MWPVPANDDYLCSFFLLLLQLCFFSLDFFSFLFFVWFLFDSISLRVDWRPICLRQWKASNNRANGSYLHLIWWDIIVNVLTTCLPNLTRKKKSLKMNSARKEVEHTETFGTMRCDRSHKSLFNFKSNSKNTYLHRFIHRLFFFGFFVSFLKIQRIWSILSCNSFSSQNSVSPLDLRICFRSASFADNRRHFRVVCIVGMQLRLPYNALAYLFFIFTDGELAWHSHVAITIVCVLCVYCGNGNVATLYSNIVTLTRSAARYLRQTNKWYIYICVWRLEFRRHDTNEKLHLIHGPFWFDRKHLNMWNKSRRTKR